MPEPSPISIPLGLQTALDKLHRRIRYATLDDGNRWQRYLVSILRGETLTASQVSRGDLAGAFSHELPPTPYERAQLHLFLRSAFPEVKVCSSRYVASTFDVTSRDAGVIYIHGRIAAALDSAGVAFLVLVSMVHELGHAARGYFGENTPCQVSLESEAVPWYAELSFGTEGGKRELQWYPEAGFLLEIKVFGGVVGVIFGGDQETADDFERISSFFLVVPDGRAFRLDLDVVESWMERKSMRPFDLDRLVGLNHPEKAYERSCAMLNSTHLPVPIGKGRKWR